MHPSCRYHERGHFHACKVFPLGWAEVVFLTQHEARRKMPPLEEYLQNADKLVQDVVDAWGINITAGNAELLTADFRTLCEKTFAYRETKRLADNHREHGGVGERLAAEETATRRAFAEAYRAFHEKHTAAT